jgi:hypothetical protein
MGVLKFSLPPGLAPEGLKELGRACVISGPDSMPYPTRVRLEPNLLVLERDSPESGIASVPWLIPGVGWLQTSTASLMDREEPYRVLVELARGKVNQVRNQAADWEHDGLHLPPFVVQAIRDSTQAFGRAVTGPSGPAVDQQAQHALVLGCQAAARLAQTYVDQVYKARHQRQPRLDTALGCQLEAVPAEEQGRIIEETFNTVVVPMSWHAVEVAEGEYRWQGSESLLDWAQKRGLAVAAGPLVDFSAARFPAWLGQGQRNRADVTSYVCDYVEVAVKRYQHRIRAWQLSAAANVAPGLAYTEEELLWLSLKMVETVRRIDPALEVIFSISQPWGDYLTGPGRVHSPFVFADTLLRNGVQLAALDVELVLGVTPRGSYCRDLLDISRMLDQYSVLGVPLQVTLGYPAAARGDARAEAGLAVAGGHWGSGTDPESQADWVEAVANLVLAKPYTRAVHWVHFSDVALHQFPHCGLVDDLGKPRPAAERLRRLRQQHLR